MTNGEKYKTAKERAEAFCHDNGITEAAELLNIRQVFNWLELEAPAEEPLPCPFCGHKVYPHDLSSADDSYHQYSVYCHNCEYSSGYSEESMAAAIAAHNRVARAAKEAK